MARRKSTRRRIGIESLEAGHLLTTTVYVEFGFDWQQATDNQGTEIGFEAKRNGNSLLDVDGVNGPDADEYVTPTLLSLDQLVHKKQVDHDGDGLVNSWDTAAIVADTLALVK